MGCARCHDHKFDPIKQKEFYQLFAYFNSIAESGIGQKTSNTPPLVYAPTPEQQEDLRAIEDRIAAAEEKLAELQPAIDEAQRAWKESLGDADPIAGFPDEGLTAHFALASAKARRFDGRRHVDGGSAGRRGPKALDAYLQDPDDLLRHRVWRRGGSAGEVGSGDGDCGRVTGTIQPRSFR